MDDQKIGAIARSYYRARPINRDELIARAQAQYRSERRRAWSVAIAASFAVLTLLVTFWVSVRPASGVYATTTGQDLIDLEDGSVAVLNVHSRLKAVYSEQARDFYLEAGQGLFKVRHDPRRPFRVHGGSTVVQATGTQFDVRIVDGEIVVAVVEGSVELQHSSSTAGTAERAPGAAATIDLAKGQSTIVRRDGRIGAIESVDVSAVAAWRGEEDRVVFKNQSLADIALEFNRHNACPKLFVEGDARELRLNLEFERANPEWLMSYLTKKHPNIEMIRQGQDIVIRHREGP